MMKNLANVACIGNDRLYLEALVGKLKKRGLAVQAFLDRKTALGSIEKNPKQFKMVIVDYILGKTRGDEAVKVIKGINPSIHAVILSSELNQQIVKICRKNGADQILDKRSTLDNLLRLSDMAGFRMGVTKMAMDKNAGIIQTILGLSGRSPRLADIAERVRIYSKTGENVLITGRSGVGKEQVAYSIHKNSQRKNYPFIAINCGAIPNELIQSELFGHKKGAFSGAIADKKGHFEAANCGTIFLDEIGEMPVHHQVSLLRVLQENKITRVGESLPKRINVRVVAATNRNIPNLIERGDFREDLYFRLNVLPIFIPELSERKEDIEPIVKFIISQKNQEAGQVKSISDEGIKYLESQIWKGNIRELESVVKRAYVESEDIINTESLLQNNEGDTNSLGLK